MTAKWRGAHGIILLLFPAIDAHAGNPPGSYQATCQNILVAGADLTAECQTTSGNWQLSALPTFSQWCAGGTISNSDGNLDCPIGSTPPSGSYALTCRNLSILGSALTAQCKTINGTWQQTALQDFAVICAAGSISNINGNLTCTPSGALPGGSYQQTCRDAWVIDGNTLNAQCQTMSGAWSSAQLQGSAGCANGINNFDGRLTCNSGSLSASGSFTQTCRLIWNNGSTLNAECQTMGGKWQETQLDNADRCVAGSISNFDGHLRCNIGGSPPSGSYTQTCRFVWLDGATLNAECLTLAQQWQSTSLANVSACASPPANINGRLECGSAGGSAPAGSYAQTCRNVLVNGTELTAQCKTIAGNWIDSSFSDYTFCTTDIANLNGVLACPGTATTPATFRIDAVPLIEQEQDSWCWAATGEMIMSYLGKPVRQSHEAYVEKGFPFCKGYAHWAMEDLSNGPGNCTGCNCGGSPPLAQFGFNGTWSSTPLSWDDLKVQIASHNTPIWFAWNWCGTGAHVMVVNGYDGTDGAQNVWVLNPEDASPELYKYAEWSAFPNLPNCNASACTCPAADTYGHAFQGDFYGIQ